MVVRTSNEPNLIADSGNTFTTFNPFPIPIVRNFEYPGTFQILTCKE